MQYIGIMAQTLKDHFHPLWRGVLGVAAPSAGAIVSCLPQVEAWLRVTSLVIGCLVGLLTAISLVRNIRK